MFPKILYFSPCPFFADCPSNTVTIAFRSTPMASRVLDELSKSFPNFDFNHLDERWWYDGAKDHRGIPVEPEEVLIERTNSFKTRLIRENIHSTAIVSHGNFIRALTGIKPKNCEIVSFDPRNSILEGIDGSRFC